MLRETVKNLFTTAQVAKSVFRPNNPAIYLEQEDFYQSFASTPITEPTNGIDMVVNGCKRIIDERIARDVIVSDVEPYWMGGVAYNPYEVFNTSIQFFDDHEAPVPSTTLVPDIDIQIYIDRVLESQKKLTISEQFDLLLDITDNHVIGAAHLGMVASRLMARNMDKRAYPGITITPKQMVAWNNSVAQFVEEGAETADGPGDTYYFWTHCFAAMVFNMNKSTTSKVMNKCFSRGTDIMVATRKYITRIPTNTSHQTASQIGRETGLTLVSTIRSANIPAIQATA